MNHKLKKDLGRAAEQASGARVEQQKQQGAAVGGAVLLGKEQKEARQEMKDSWASVVRGPSRFDGSSSSQDESEFEPITIGATRHIPYLELDRLTNEFNYAGKLGAGGSGSVYRAKWNHTEVAVKRLDSWGGEMEPHEAKQVFVNEVHTLASFRHPNIIDLLGYSSDGPVMCLVLLLAEHGSLSSRLSKSGAQSLAAAARVQVLSDVACGLAYIHKQGHVHRDIKSANVLLNQHDNALICDFGMARQGDSQMGAATRVLTMKTKFIVGTQVYMSPEVIRGSYSDRSDVFAFGVICLEVLTGLDPSPCEGREDIVTHLQDALEDAPDGMSGLLHSVWFTLTQLWKPVVSLASECLDYRKNKRPSASEARAKLRDLCDVCLECAERVVDDELTCSICFEIFANPSESALAHADFVR